MRSPFLSTSTLLDARLRTRIEKRGPSRLDETRRDVPLFFSCLPSLRRSPFGLWEPTINQSQYCKILGAATVPLIAEFLSNSIWRV